MADLQARVGSSGVWALNAPSIYPVRGGVPNQRYLFTQDGRPWLMQGDSPHVVPAKLTLAQMDTYFAALQTAGFNAFWVDIFGDTYFFNGRSDWGLEDGTDPFTGTLGGGQYDFTTPNEIFFVRIDAMVSNAATYGLCLFFNCFDPAGVLSHWTANGTARVQSLGTFLGARYTNSPNLVWFFGNDFQTWTTQADSDLLLAFIQAVRIADGGRHLLTTQMEYPESGSLDNATTRPATDIGGTYAYYPIYAYVRAQYESAEKTAPIYLQETWYPNHTFQANGTTLPPSTLVLRKQAYWGTLAGALAGYLFGNDLTDGFNTGWETAFTVGYATFASDLGYWRTFFTSVAWHTLVPDWGATLVTAGRGTYAATGSADTNNYVTVAADGTSGLSLLVAYCPASTTLTVDLSKMRASTTARWYDPTNGTYSTIGGSPFTNSGTQNAATPGTNSAGASDWVLRLDA